MHLQEGAVPEIMTGLELPRTVMRYDGRPFNRPNYHPFRGIREEEEVGGSAGGNNDVARPH